MIGRELGRFRIVAPLGTGGMASVWRAHDRLLGRDLAIKILSASLANSSDARRRFRHEAHIAAQLDHPGIAAVYDSGETEDVTWIAMALIEGETLAERLARSLVPVAQVVAIAEVVADALGYAHGRGVVHRDVTARNVMLARDGRVFVLDFGLALAQGASRISSSGTTVGTAPYIAPEVLLGATADARSDLYGLGVVLYEALTGALPFAAANRPAATIFSVLNDSVRPPREWRPEIPAALDAAVMSCLARDPNERFGDAGELASVLREIARTLRGESVDPASDVRTAPDAPATPASGATTASLSRSAIADRLADRSGPVYLAIPAFECEAEAGAARETQAVARGIARAAAATLTQLQRMHVVPAEVELPGRSPEALRAYARALGAQLLLLGSLRRAGTRLRLTYAVCDPEASLQIAGDTLEGSALDPFELEERVLASLKHVLAREPVDSEAVTRELRHDPAAEEHFRQAMRYLERHDHEASVDGAIAILERLLASEGSRAEYQAALARACLFKYELSRQRGWEARAAAAAQRAAELAPDTPETLLALGDVHRIAGRLAEAEREYGLALAQRSDFYEARLGRARALEGLGHVREGEAEVEKAIRSKPSDWRGYVLLGRLRFSHGRFEEAVEPWKKVASMVPDNALAARNLGSALLHLDRVDDAIGEFQRAIEIRPDASVFTNLGTALFYVGRYEEASDAFRRSAAMLPTDPVKWGNLGNSLRFTPGREAEAPPALERAVGLMRERLDRNPGSAEAWGRLAGWLANLGREEEARAAACEALRHDSEDVHVLSHVGHVWVQLGDRDEAVRLFRKAVELGFSRLTLRRSPDLQVLRGHPEFEALLSG